jgi:hypothetical protein
MVCCAGQGREGALTVLRRGLVAETLARAALPATAACKGVWVLPSSSGAGEAEAEAPLQGFVVLALERSTMVVRYAGQAFEAVSSLQDLGFYAQATTLALAPVGGGRGLVQVYGGDAPGLRLVWDGQAAQDMALHDDAEVGGAGLPQGSKVLAVDVCDPYVLLLLADGALALLRLDVEEAQMVVARAPGGGGSRVTAACLFQHRHGQGMRGGPAEGPGFEAALAAAVAEDEHAKDDEETMLYGEEAEALVGGEEGPGSRDADVHFADGPRAQQHAEGMDVCDDAGLPNGGDAPPPLADGVLCALCRRDGTLEVVALDSLRPAFLTRRAAIGPRLLRNALLYPDLPAFARTHDPARAEASTPTTITELRVVLVGPSDGQPSDVLGRLAVLMWTSDEDLLVYGARPVGGAAGRAPHALPWSLVKVPHDVITRPPRKAPRPRTGGCLRRRVFKFGGIGAQRGVCVGGARPLCVLAERGRLTVQLLTVRDTYATLPAPPAARLVAFAEFGDVDRGFVAIHSGASGPSTLSICSLDTGGALGLSCATGAAAALGARKVQPLGVEVRRIVTLDAARIPSFALAASPAVGYVDEEEERQERAAEEKERAAAAAAGEGDDDEDPPEGGFRGSGLEELQDWTAPSEEYLGRPPLPGLWAPGGHQVREDAG